MPRSRHKTKQTRLAFTPIISHQNDESPSGKTGRLANVHYNHPSAASVAIRPTSSNPVSPVDKTSPIRKRPADSSSSDTPKASTSSPHVINDAESSSDDEIVVKPHRRLRKTPTPKPIISLDSNSEDSDDPVVSSPAKRRKRNVGADVPYTPRRNSDQAKLDLEEDLEDLQDSVVKETRTRGRLANSARAKRQQHLETLRRRRAGDKEQGTADSDSEGRSHGSESDNHSAESPVCQARLRRQAMDSDDESSVASNEDLDKSDDDFVLADENAELGAPTGSDEIPLEFTRHAYKQTKEYFQDAVEWMVHNQLNPAFPRTSPHFKFAFAKLEDEVRGRTGSQLLSSSWNAAFRRAVMARPYMEDTSYPVIEQHPCDACNRSGHPASSDVKFYGKPYSLETLEPLSEEGSDDGQPEGNGERDRDGNILPDEERRFLLGKHCKSMATMAHTLIHWRFHLNEWVTGYLEFKGILDDEEIIERSRWSQGRKTKFADETLGMMIQTGEVQKLWRDFHINLKTARETTSRW